MNKLILLLLLLVSSAVNADQYYRARTITGVGAYSFAGQSVFFFSVSGDASGMPACSVTNRLPLVAIHQHIKILLR